MTCNESTDEEEEATVVAAMDVSSTFALLKASASCKADGSAACRGNRGPRLHADASGGAEDACTGLTPSTTSLASVVPTGVEPARSTTGCSTSRSTPPHGGAEERQGEHPSRLPIQPGDPQSYFVTGAPALPHGVGLVPLPAVAVRGGVEGAPEWGVAARHPTVVQGVVQEGLRTVDGTALERQGEHPSRLPIHAGDSQSYFVTGAPALPAPPDAVARGKGSVVDLADSHGGPTLNLQPLHPEP